MISQTDIEAYMAENPKQPEKAKDHPQPFRCNDSVATYFPFGKTTVNDIQYGGNHYKKYGNLQPWDVITAWNLGYLDGTALKYIARWKDKNGVEDLRKAIHFLEKTIEVYGTNQKQK